MNSGILKVITIYGLDIKLIRASLKRRLEVFGRKGLGKLCNQTAVEGVGQVIAYFLRVEVCKSR